MIGCDIYDLSISSTSRNMRWIHIAKPIHWPKGLRETDIINEGSSFDLEATPGAVRGDGKMLPFKDRRLGTVIVPKWLKSA
jgi:hypothetical protein